MTAREDAVEALRQALLDEGIEEGAVEAMLHMVKPNETNLVGNYADLQRLGVIATTGTMPTPPGEADIETSNLADAFVEPQPQGDDGGSPEAGAEEGEVDYEAMTKAELQAELDAQGIEYSASATKADLIEALG